MTTQSFTEPTEKKRELSITPKGTDLSETDLYAMELSFEKYSSNWLNALPVQKTVSCSRRFCDPIGLVTEKHAGVVSRR